ncbi:MAG: hypothetical protein R3Y29_01045 [bacterium]
MSIPDNISKTRIKKLTHNNRATQLYFVLIGQVGKHISKYEKSNTTCEDILSTAISVVQEANSLIPCRFMLIECSKVISELNIYENNGFKFFQTDGELYQYIKKYDDNIKTTL